MAAEITVTGTLTRDPEIKYAQSGTAMLKLALAATRRQQNRNTKQWEDDGDPLYIDVTFFGDRENYLGDILHKGDQLSVSGALVRRNWESRQQDGRRPRGAVPEAPRLRQEVRQGRRRAGPRPDHVQHVQRPVLTGATGGGKPAGKYPPPTSLHVDPHKAKGTSRWLHSRS